MKRIVYVFIENDTVKCYPNLKQLTDDNPKVNYFHTYRALKSSPIVKEKSFTIAADTMKYNTKRRPPHNDV